jgi:dihydrofolate reductase
MGRVCVVNFTSLDGVIQSPLSSDEDRAGGFDRGGWVPPCSDQVVDDFMQDATVRAAALLLGRRTHEVLAAAWAEADESDAAVEAMNRMPKYVVSSSSIAPAWPGSQRLTGGLGAAVDGLKADVDGDIVVLGSGTLVRGLAEHDLVDEYRLLIFPVVLGAGKRMFDDRASAARFRLTDTTLSTSGVAIHTFVRDRNASAAEAVPPA